MLFRSIFAIIVMAFLVAGGTSKHVLEVSNLCYSTPVCTRCTRQFLLRLTLKSSIEMAILVVCISKFRGCPQDKMKTSPAYGYKLCGIPMGTDGKEKLY